GNLALNAVLNAALYRVGVWGIPLATSLVNIAGTAALLLAVRRRLGRVEGRALLSSYARIATAAALAGGAAFAVWYGLDEALGRSLGAQVASVGLGGSTGVAVYLLAARLLGVRELQTLLSLRRRSATTG
ncbi:MAG TPA: polysaccharide biosynthesis C-terminal domain-containing protein, partial [Gaiellaceae bacterium]|nr:polysaccharide biosynthesis C-terminal domain-containing protein [Gaiellaceae bacterium]